MTGLWTTPAAELAGWVATLAAWHETAYLRGGGAADPFDQELAIGALCAARHRRRAGKPCEVPEVAMGVEMLIHMRASLDAPQADTREARLAWATAWQTYREIVDCAARVLPQQHANATPAELTAWERGAS